MKYFNFIFLLILALALNSCFDYGPRPTYGFEANFVITNNTQQQLQIKGDFPDDFAAEVGAQSVVEKTKGMFFGEEGGGFIKPPPLDWTYPSGSPVLFYNSPSYNFALGRVEWEFLGYIQDGSEIMIYNEALTQANKRTTYDLVITDELLENLQQGEPVITSWW